MGSVLICRNTFAEAEGEAEIAVELAHKYHKREDESVERRRVVMAVGAHLRQITCKIYVCTIAYV